MRNNTLVVHDEEYVLDAAYRQGAQAMRKGIPWDANPYGPRSERAEQWSCGHVNESAGFHRSQYDEDIIKAPKANRQFKLMAAGEIVVGERPVLALLDIAREKFEAGEGVITLHQNMPDVVILGVVKQALAIGKPFQVIPSSL